MAASLLPTVAALVAARRYLEEPVVA